jgi:hypothetical protein
MQVIEKWPLLARLQFAPRSIFSKSPCIFVKSKEIPSQPPAHKSKAVNGMVEMVETIEAGIRAAIKAEAIEAAIKA